MYLTKDKKFNMTPMKSPSFFLLSVFGPGTDKTTASNVKEFSCGRYSLRRFQWSLFFFKYLSILNTMQAGKRKALKVTIPAAARLPLQIYFFFCTFWSSQEYKEEKTHIFHFSSAGFFLWYFFTQKSMLLRTSLSLVVNTYLCFRQKNLVLNLNV